MFTFLFLYALDMTYENNLVHKDLFKCIVEFISNASFHFFLIAFLFINTFTYDLLNYSKQIIKKDKDMCLISMSLNILHT